MSYKMKGKSAKKFEEDLANRNNPKNVELFKNAEEVFKGMNQKEDVKTND